jgi:hypothetical protein
MANRIQSRRSDGTFRRSTLADIGLDCDVCPNPDCRSFCPHKLGIEKRPTHCHACASMLEWALERMEQTQLWRSGEPE